MPLDYLNALDADAAVRELLRCCGSTRWADRMASSRPFADEAAMLDRADAIWWALDPQDWLEAFSAHPKIGALATTRWSAQEQSGMAGAAAAVSDRLARGNRDYEARFGYIFIICATGKPAGEMLEALEQRLGNTPDRELRIAAEEQRKITRLRVAKLIDGDRPQAATDGRTDRP
jgi:2-oxo-4-hydroxy-4-carboxy-5-ureidoimidazoline decarboxylase